MVDPDCRLVAIFMLLLDITVVNVALPSIQRALHSSFSDLQWVVNAYALTLAAFLLTSGAVADLIGRRRVFVIGPRRVHLLLGGLWAVGHARWCSTWPAPCRAPAAR